MTMAALYQKSIGYDMRKTEKRGQVGPRISSSCFHQLYWLFPNSNRAWVKTQMSQTEAQVRVDAAREDIVYCFPSMSQKPCDGGHHHGYRLRWLFSFSRPGPSRPGRRDGQESMQ
ncbi:MAG: hypothetical protein IJG13_13915 [Kiritimatiellae bacterium]|nr:hypothetical protein [Kiritimatiellia bacterium]